MSKPFNPSAKQIAIFNWIEYGTGSLIVTAVAGSGKSTTMVHGLEYIPEEQNVLMLAFNAAIAKDLKVKVASLGKDINRSFWAVKPSTFHALGYGMLIKALGYKPNTDDKKCRRLARTSWGPEEFKLYANFCCKLVGMAKGEGFGAIRAANANDWFNLVEHHDLTLESEEANMERAIELARSLLRLSNERAKEGQIDYDDMLYLPLAWKLAFTQYDWVIIDEAQDTNPVRRAVAAKSLREGGRLIAVGDPKQGIYGFTGASHDAIDLIRKDFNCQDLPLTVSYRCPKAVGRVAQGLVPYFEVHDDAPEGDVLDLKLNDALSFLGPNDAVLCRMTRPLVSMAYELLAQGVACKVLGSEIGKGLVVLIEQMNAATIDGLGKKLEAYEKREVTKLMAKEEDTKANNLMDRVACVMTFIANLVEGKRTIEHLKKNIEDMFRDGDGPMLTLCTAHKAKGREWGTVAILEPELMPMKARKPWQADQEQNLIYVAVTRAQERLIYIQTEEKR